MSASNVLSTLWVCVDCFWAYHDGDYTPTDDATPFSLFDLSDGARTIGSYVSPGLLSSEHADGCDFLTSNGYMSCSYDGECEIINFSSRWCDACGTDIAGTRHAMTLWESE